MLERNPGSFSYRATCSARCLLSCWPCQSLAWFRSISQPANMSCNLCRRMHSISLVALLKSLETCACAPHPVTQSDCPGTNPATQVCTSFQDHAYFLPQSRSLPALLLQFPHAFCVILKQERQSIDLSQRQKLGEDFANTSQVSFKTNKGTNTYKIIIIIIKNPE